MSPLGVLVMAYGGPDSPDDVAPYLQDVRGGRPTPSALVEEVRERYRRIGGRSPIRAITERQAAALGRELRARGVLPAVEVGMRHWHPRIAPAVERLARQGVTRAVGLALAPHYSRRSVGAYRERAQEAADALPAAPRFAFVSHFGDHPRFVAAAARGVRSALASLRDAANARVLFSAHSLPEAWVTDGDPYPAQLRASAAAVAAAAGVPPNRWRQCYQSAGARPGRWLGPSLEEELRSAAGDGVTEVIAAPFGFVADHVEVLFDVDVELRDLGASLGVSVTRTPGLDCDPDLIAALADRVQQEAARL